MNDDNSIDPNDLIREKVAWLCIVPAFLLLVLGAAIRVCLNAFFAGFGSTSSEPPEGP